MTPRRERDWLSCMNASGRSPAPRAISASKMRLK
jgi:hypothetical protein